MKSDESLVESVKSRDGYAQQLMEDANSFFIQTSMA